MDPHSSSICIIRLGRAAGKVKYTLVDEDDLAWLGSKKIRCDIELVIDRNGNGTSVQAVCYHHQGSRPPHNPPAAPLSQSPSHGATTSSRDCPSSPLLGRFHSNNNLNGAGGGGMLTKTSLHAMIWQHHMGRIVDGFEVVHCNNLTLDNRLANLRLQPLSSQVRKRKHHTYEDKENSVATTVLHSNSHSDQDLYYRAVSLISSDPEEEQRVPRPRFCLDANGDRVAVDVYHDLFYECHYGPCTEIEQEMRQFTMCGRCCRVRYCSQSCQADDWPIHKQFCKHKKGRSRPELGPER